jgi:hypothetical protein
MRPTIAAFTALALLAAPAAYAQDEPPLTLELNKLEPVPAAAGAAASCRAYLVAANPDNGARFDALRLDLVLFGTDGVIARRLALDLGPIQPGRTQVRLFDVHDLPCESIGQMLVNDTMICKIGGADHADCMDRLRTSSRVSAKLVK